jgi:outer membrane protein
MKPISWIINGVLAIAIIVLYFLHFKGTSVTHNKAALLKGNMKIAYFEIDSIQNNYVFFQEVKAALQAKEQANSSQLTALRNEYNSKLQDFQKNAKTLTQSEQESRQQELMKIEKNFMALDQQLTQGLQVESNNRLMEVRKKIEDFLATYNKDKAFAFIFSNDPGLMYYKDTAYDITGEIIKGLNEAYTAKK